MVFLFAGDLQFPPAAGDPIDTFCCIGSSDSVTSRKEETFPLSDTELDCLADIANKTVDAAGVIILKHYLARGNVFNVSNAKTSIAAEAEKAMISLILKDLPDHAVYGKQTGWNNCSGPTIPEFVWVLDPVNGVVDGLLPTFGTSIAVVHNGKPVIGCINNPVARSKPLGGGARLLGTEILLGHEHVSTSNKHTLILMILVTMKMPNMPTIGSRTRLEKLFSTATVLLTLNWLLVCCKSSLIVLLSPMVFLG
uniref:Bifunctional phosphatase IMPL2, chloroplastic-like n=1 Tax=Nicotiana sylvestris TaxID=4096 RepID=A0A1U7YGI8_NICSY|nr:PREDICTED: bifunctional phosphatase IMPL2, chloroplastic-like [Nicotiana sylvestris]